MADYVEYVEVDEEWLTF